MRREVVRDGEGRRCEGWCAIRATRASEGWRRCGLFVLDMMRRVVGRERQGEGLEVGRRSKGLGWLGMGRDRMYEVTWSDHEVVDARQQLVGLGFARDSLYVLLVFTSAFRICVEKAA